MTNTNNYDGQSNIKSITDAINTDFSITNLNYDGLDRLISSTGGTSRGNTSLTYDIFGNILTYNTKDKNLTYAYDSNNRLTTVTDTTGTVIRNFVSGYDSKGNVTANGTQDSNGNNRSFSYNAANQMTTANTNSYRYDGHNRRVVENKNGRKNYSFYNKEGSLVYRETPAGALNYIFLGKASASCSRSLPTSL